MSPSSYLLTSAIGVEIDTETRLVLDYLAMYEKGDKPIVVNLIFNDEEICQTIGNRNSLV